MIARVVIGASFGDESKGALTDYLCAKQGAGMVVRFNGGAQAGHTVVTPEGKRHVFHHFGCGTFSGVPTYLSSFFVCNPILFLQELAELRALGLKPEVFAHPDCLVTTHGDMVINQVLESRRAQNRHGSCGVGFFETLNRSKYSRRLKITMADLWAGGKNLEAQLAEICGTYAQSRVGEVLTESAAVIPTFLRDCAAFAAYVKPLNISQCPDPVFEGAQGLLLDQDNRQYFPYLTPSHTGMKNVEILCALAGIEQQEIYYVSRTYLTRHGAGPLPGEDPAMSFADDTNASNPFQGTLRFAPLDAAAAVALRARCAEDAAGKPYKLVLTHCDQLAPPCEAEMYCNGPTRQNVRSDLFDPVGDPSRMV